MPVLGADVVLCAGFADRTWSSTGNRQLVADVATDLDDAIAAQGTRST